MEEKIALFVPYSCCIWQHIWYSMFFSLVRITFFKYKLRANPSSRIYDQASMLLFITKFEIFGNYSWHKNCLFAIFSTLCINHCRCVLKNLSNIFVRKIPNIDLWQIPKFASQLALKKWIIACKNEVNQLKIIKYLQIKKVLVINDIITQVTFTY